MVNKATLIGYVGQAPDIRTTQDGREIASFSIATTERWKDKNTGERKEKTEWHKVVIFNAGLASIVKQYVKKGSRLYVEGTIQTRKYSDKQGIEKHVTEIVLQNFGGALELLDSKQDSDSGNKQSATYSAVDGMMEESDEIPF
jgi:single-strand DNA-binding protein